MTPAAVSHELSEVVKPRKRVVAHQKARRQQHRDGKACACGHRLSRRPLRVPDLSPSPQQHTLLQLIDIKCEETLSSPRWRMHGVALAEAHGSCCYYCMVLERWQLTIFKAHTKSDLVYKTVNIHREKYNNDVKEKEGLKTKVCTKYFPSRFLVLTFLELSRMFRKEACLGPVLLAASSRSCPTTSFLGKPVQKYYEASKVVEDKLIWKPHKILELASPGSWG